MGGAFVCAALGIVPTVRHADYLGSWLDIIREDNRAIVRAASAASNAANFLLDFRGQPATDQPDTAHPATWRTSASSPLIRMTAGEGKRVAVRLGPGGRR